MSIFETELHKEARRAVNRKKVWFDYQGKGELI